MYTVAIDGNDRVYGYIVEGKLLKHKHNSKNIHSNVENKCKQNKKEFIESRNTYRVSSRRILSVSILFY